MQKKRFFVAVDCEGVSCAVGKPGGTLGESDNYAFVQRQATCEANAAVRALYDAGAEQVIVWDNHHSGINLDYLMLDKRCDILSGSGHRGRFPTIDDTFGGVLFIGYHSRDNTATAVMAHTYSSLTYQSYTINGREVGEMEIDAAFAGLHGVPVIFVSSDDITVSQAKDAFPWAETVATKVSLSHNSALSKHPLRVCEEINAAVTTACARLEEMRPFTFTEPLNVEIRFKRMDAAQTARLTDRHGEPFALTDPFTRAGTIASIRNLL